MKQDKNLDLDITTEVTAFNQEDLNEAIDDQIVAAKRSKFKMKLAEANKALGKTKLFNFSKGKV
jgi:spermidine/putrescine transport system permease protein